MVIICFCKNAQPQAFDWVSKYVSRQCCQKNRHLKSSVQGPLLFLLHKNDLNQAIELCKPHHFADYTNLFRPWDYVENFSVYSWFNGKSKTCFFTFHNVQVSWIEWDQILVSQLSPPKLRYFADQNRPKEGPHEDKFWQFSNAKMSFLNS